MASGQDPRRKDSCWPEATSYRQPTCCWSAQSNPIQAATAGRGEEIVVFMVKTTPQFEWFTTPETLDHPYSGVLEGPHLSRPLRFLVPPPFESLSLTLAGSGRVFVTGAGVTNPLIFAVVPATVKLEAQCFPHHSLTYEERKRNQKRKN